MINDQYTIQQYIFEVGYSRREKAYQLQDRFCRLFYGQAVPVMEEAFHQLLPPHRIIQLEKLVVDIGTLKADRLEQDFAIKFKDALEKELTALLQTLPGIGSNAETAGNSVAYNQSLTALLEHFLLTGTLPWWASGQLMNDPVAVLEQLLNRDAAAVKNLLLRVGQQEGARKRIVYQFPVAVLRAVISVLEPEQAVFIFGYHTAVSNLQQQRQVVKSEMSEFEKAAWIFILTYLLTDRGNYFNRKAFVRSTLQQMARHFNTGYEVLLRIFSDALRKDDPAMQLADSLPHIIRELAQEHAAVMLPGREHVIQDRGEQETVAGELQQKMELVRYYLVTGVLPVWAMQYDAGRLPAVLGELIAIVPRTVKKMMNTLAISEAVQARLAGIPDDAVLKNIVYLEEPAQAGFILRYVHKVQERRRETGMIQAEEKTFRQSVWQFVLSYLYTERGSMFNTRMFLESQVRQMALHYRVEYGQLLAVLTSDVGDMIPAGEDGSLFNLLAALLQEYRSGEKAQEPFKLPLPDAVAEDNKAGAATLRHILYYWLQYDHYPWWDTIAANRPAESLWKELYQQDPAAVTALLQYAGLQEPVTRRLVYRLPAEILIDGFRLLQGGNAAAGAYHTMLRLLAGNGLVKLRSVAVQQAELLFIMWTILKKGNYTTFNNELFIREVVEWLSGWTNVYPDAVLRSLFKTAGKMTGSIPASFREQLQTLADYTYRDSRRDLLFHLPDITILIREYLLYGRQADREAVLREGIRLLRMLLQGKSLPAPFTGMSDARIKVLLEQLVRWLYRESKPALQEILEQETGNPVMRMHLHDIFFPGSTGIYREISVLLQQYAATDTLRYLLASSAGLFGSSHVSSLQLVAAARQRLREQEVVNWLRMALSSPGIARMVAQQYNDEDIYALLTALHGSGSRASVDFIKELQLFMAAAVSNTTEREKLLLLYREFILQLTPGAALWKDPAAFVRALLAFIATRQPGLIRLLQPVVGNHAYSPAIIAVIPVLQQQLQQQQDHLQEQQSAEQALQLTIPKRQKQDTSEELQQIIFELESKKQQAAEEQKKEAEKIFPDEDIKVYIRNAGLVLLHPLLPTLFSRLQWLEKNKFTSEAAQFRAVHLLQFLVFGTEQHPEHELVLNKILCGLLPETPVPADIILTGPEKAMAEELLKVVRGQWEKMKNTSADGFRVSFLQRNGALTENEDHWTLRVEQRGIDVLLSSLPWGIGMIKSSWMNKILYVEWT